MVAREAASDPKRTWKNTKFSLIPIELMGFRCSRHYMQIINRNWKLFLDIYGRMRTIEA
jgi:hypothetical protein